jgi:signal transduction histidine kinase
MALNSGASRHRFDLPEVTFLAMPLELCTENRHAVSMKNVIKSILSPMNLAGLMAWAAIGWELASGTHGTSAWVTEATPKPVLLGLHGMFMLLFLWPNKTRLTVIAQLIIALGLMSIIRASSLPILLIIVMAQVVQLWHTRMAAGIFIATNLFVYCVYAYAWQFTMPLVMTMMYMSFQGFAAMTSWYAFTAEQSRDRLAAINAELIGTRTLLDASARDSERLRISRELHDVAGHKLTALKLNLKVLQRNPQIAPSAELQLSAELADELLQDIRAVVQQLRLYDGLPLHEALSALAAPLPRLELDLQLSEDSIQISVTEAETILRCVQEALTNAAKHSNAQHLSVVLQRNGAFWNLDIRDDGDKKPEVADGGGLRGMQERFEGLGGTLNWSAVAGMPLRASWPVRE